MSHINKKAKLAIREGADGLTSSTGSDDDQSRNSSPSSPPAAQSLWDRAYDALAKKMPNLVKEYDELLAKEEQMAISATNETTPAQLPAPNGLDISSDRSRRQAQLNTVIQNGLQRMKTNKATYKIGGHEFVLTDQIPKAERFLFWVRHWLGSAVKDLPEASMVWSGVCLIIPLLTDPTTAAKASRDGFIDVTSRIRYYVAFEHMLRRQGPKTWDQWLMSYGNDMIVELYQAILEFQLSTVLHFYQSHLETCLHTVATSSTDPPVTTVDVDIRDDEVVRKIFVRLDHKATLEKIERLEKMSYDTRAIMDSALTVLDVWLEERLLAGQQKCLQIFNLARNGNDATYDWYKDRVESRADGTCEWFLQHELFQKWLLQESGPLLVSADPECGKSVLAKYLVDEGLATQSAIICYFFFKDQDQNTSRQALCALLHQLFSQRGDLAQHAMELYNKWDASQVQFDTLLWTILRDAVHDPLVGPVIFVIDALDECAESQLSSLMENLKDILGDQQQSNARFKLLMTSRPCERVVSEVHRSLQDDLPRIHIPTFKAISQDINSVIYHRINQLATAHQLSDEIKSSLNSKLLAIDNRTYLWVHLVFDYLDKGLKNTEAGIDAAIQTLPNTVNEAYSQILGRSQEEGTVETVTRALSIILAARRPLTLSEMNIAMNLTGQGRGRCIYDLDLEQDVDFESRLRTLCDPFVNFHDDNIYFFHQTAREFLLQSSAPTAVSSDLQWHHSITTRHAHSVLAETCMLYLDRLESTRTDTFRLGDHHGALFKYSVEHWGDHCREAEFENGSAMVDLAAALCTPDLTSHSQWASIVSRRYHIRPGSSTNVLIASHLGLAPVIELLLGRGADIEAKDTQGRTALMLAAKSGHEAVTRLLLQNGADVKAENDRDRSALMIAAEAGHEAVTRILLDHGADVEARDYDGWTALICAAIHGHEAVARLLLENGANVETSDVCGWAAFMHAAFSGHEAVTRLLLDRGANVEAEDDDGMTALMYAANSGHEAVTRLLLDNGADVDAEDCCVWTALMHAAKSGHEAVTRLLLEHGANVEAIDAEGGTALMLAAEFGNEAVTRLLLEYDAMVNVDDEVGWTALINAAYCGQEAVTRLLLANDADVDAQDTQRKTALIHATQSGHETVAKLLLDYGAEVDEMDENYGTAVLCAAADDSTDLLRLLLDHDADVDVKDKGGMTALMNAAIAGHEATVRLLLEFGADIEEKHPDGWTAMMYAAHNGHEGITKLLLDYGSSVETKHSTGWSILMLTAGRGLEAIVQLLLANRAKVEERDPLGTTALMLAAKNGHEAVVRRLLRYGARTEATDYKGRTALMLAAEHGHTAVARLLLENGANVEAQTKLGRRTVLMHAARFGHEAMIRLLLENGADIEARAHKGVTALMLAADYGLEAIARLLLENGAIMEALDYCGRTALMHAAKSGHEAAVRLLLQNGALTEAADDKGKTALLLAVESGHEGVLRPLFKFGANVEAAFDYGKTALMYAAELGHTAVARLLLQNGADIKKKYIDGRESLMFAAQYGHEDAARLLLNKGADIEPQTTDGRWTALMLAVEFGHEALVRLLLGYGANVLARDSSGRTALRLAVIFDNIRLIWLLLRNGAGAEAMDWRDREALLETIQGWYRSREALIQRLLEIGVDIKLVPLDEIADDDEMPDADGSTT